MNDLNAAMKANEEAVKLIPPGHPNRAMYLNNLSTVLQRRYGRTGSIDDLNAAVKVNDEAVKLTPHDNPGRAMFLNNLGIVLLSRFDRTGSMEDLNSAMKANEETVELTPHDHPHRAMYLNNLGKALLARSQRTGSSDDLNAAVKANQEAVKSAPSDHPNLGMYLNNLGNALLTRFKRTGSTVDLNVAVKVNEEAVKSTPHDHLNRAVYLNSLGIALACRFARTESREDLNTAMEVNKEVIKLTPSDHPHLAIYLDNFGNMLVSRFDQMGSMDDLNAAVEAKRETIKLTPHAHPDRARRLANLGQVLQTRFEQTKSMDDLNAAVNAYDESLGSHQSPPNIRILSAIRGANLIYTQNLKSASRMLTTAVQLLPTTSPRTLHRDDQKTQLSEFDGLASHAAALSIRAEENVFEALRLLELGRGVMASVHFDTRSDITELENVQPELAKKFKFLRDELDLVNDNLVQNSLSDAQRTQQSHISRRYEASKKFDDIITKIRSHDRFKNFLLGPSSNELKQIAIHGPIVFINASLFGSDAFLITHDNITHLPLPRLTFSDLETKSKALLQSLDNTDRKKFNHYNKLMTETLEWLWDVVVEPILVELGFTETPENDNAWPHVWWIPVGWLSLFPIHAAGYYSIHGRKTALDRVISSYTPTVRALHHARDQIKQLSTIRSQIVLMVNMPTTPNQNPLPFVDKEINAIDNLLPGSIKRIKLRHPIKSEVVDIIRQCSVAHFACHGSVNNHLEPQILLKDWETNPFSVVDMVGIKLDQVQLAYLSACHAANNRNLALLDEAVHMAGACQLAGFPTVIGTMWQIPDEQSATVAECVYRAMLTEDDKLDSRKAADGLHFAIRKIMIREESKRAKGSKLFDGPMAWAPYIHVGA